MLAEIQWSNTGTWRNFVAAGRTVERDRRQTGHIGERQAIDDPCAARTLACDAVRRTDVETVQDL